jgi:hypothetical protein
MFVLLTKYHSDDEIEKPEIGRECSMFGGEERCIQGFLGEPEGRRLLENPGVDWRIILKWIFEKWDGRHRLYRCGSG